MSEPTGTTSRELDTSNAPRFTTTVALKHFPLPVSRFALAETAEGFYRFDAAILVAHRDTGLPMELHWAMFFPPAEEKQIVAQMYATLYNMLIHELAEAWLVDGTRPDDPHGDLGRMSAYIYAEGAA